LNKGILFGENPCVTLDIIQNEAGNHIPVSFDIPWMDSQRKSASLHIEQYCINSAHPASGLYSLVNITTADAPSSSDLRWGTYQGKT
jgi:hypothetical protein